MRPRAHAYLIRLMTDAGDYKVMNYEFVIVQEP